jgi:hypothetical protein
MSNRGDTIGLVAEAAHALMRRFFHIAVEPFNDAGSRSEPLPLPRLASARIQKASVSQSHGFGPFCFVGRQLGVARVAGLQHDDSGGTAAGDWSTRTFLSRGRRDGDGKSVAGTGDGNYEAEMPDVDLALAQP